MGLLFFCSLLLWIYLVGDKPVFPFVFQQPTQFNYISLSSP